MLDLTPYTDRIYSQFGEDGITLELVQRLQPPKFYAEIGAGDGTENNTRVLKAAGWEGVWFDASWGTVDVRCHRFTVANARTLFNQHHVPTEFGVLSIDVHGNDYWIWRALGWHFRPYIVIIEAQIQRPHDRPYIMPYDPEYVWDNESHDCGASVFSLVELGRQLGYAFVGKTPDPHSPNCFFVRDDLVSKL